MIKFYSSKKKPNIYSMLIVSAIALVCIMIFAGSSSASGIVAGYIGIVVWFAVLSLMLLRAFVLQMRFEPYSYNSIYYFGFFLFFLSVEVISLFNLAALPEYIREGQLVMAFSVFEGAVKTYIFLTSPFLLIYSIMLCVSNISLIRHEGKRPVNMLGILLSFLMIGGVVLLYRVDYYVSGSLTYVMIHEMIVIVYSVFFLYFECMLLGSMVAGAVSVRYRPEQDKDFIVILGCGIRKDGTPTPLLRGRIDRALEFSRRQEEETGRQVTFVTSGGQGPNEVISESACMKRYLLEQGIPETRIIEEDQSRSTYENMKFSAKKIREADPEGKVAYSTTNYHVFRSGMMAHRAGMEAVGIGAKTKWYFWPNAAVREFVGILSENRKQQALILIIMIVVNILMVWVNYRVF